MSRPPGPAFRRIGARRARATIAGAARAIIAGGLIALAGCVPLAAISTLPARPGAARDSTRLHPGPAPGVTPGTKPTPVAADTTPSAEALAVLASIPEPLAPGERVPPPEVAAPSPAADTSGRNGGAADSVEAGGEAPDSTGHAEADSAGAEVPVPSPTPVLGEHPNPLLFPGADSTKADSAGAAGRATGVPPASGSPASGTGSSGSSAAGKPGTAPGATSAPRAAPPTVTCWRVQIGAPKEKDEAGKKRAAAESLLLVTMVVEREGGLWKIRTRDCYSRATADIVRGRAVESGFAGAFVIEGAAH